jgi:hypothetical protein
MGMSLVLLPMFLLSHSFSWKWVKIALGLLSLGVVLVGVSSIFQNKTIEQLGYGITLYAMFLYGIQILIIYKTRARVEKDIYLKSILVSFVFFSFSLILGLSTFITQNEKVYLAIGWFAFGFVLFLISGHFYKIIPFLVWFERFSPFVGKKKVSMLADMVPLKSAHFQLFMSAFGWLVVGIGLIVEQNSIFYSGASFLSIGVIFLLKDIVFMINFKG